MTEIVTRHILAENRSLESMPKVAHSASSSVRILVADDNPINQKLVRRLLEKSGCRVDLVSTGVEAVQWWEMHSYDAILMDCQMPEMDGFEATQEIRRREQTREQKNATYSRIPIIALTANTMSGDREKCINAGMDDFVPKPIPVDAIERLVQRWALANWQVAGNRVQPTLV